tara:strand:- start:1523 stop:2029 length:507 start_codon:yes stop_codon:yes gene_type:complete
MFLTIDDFNFGKYELGRGSYDVTRLQDYINSFEQRYLTDMLGADLYAEFKADVILGTGYPTEVRFQKIFDAFSIDHHWTILHSGGIIEMLKGFIYYEYTKDQIVAMTNIGNVRPVGENSEIPSTLYTQIYNRYNEGIRSYRAVQCYILDNKVDYDGYNGQRKLMAYWL